MFDMSLTINKMVTLFVLMMTGFALRKMKIVDDTGRKSLSKIAMNIVIPCCVLHAAFTFEISLDGLGGFMLTCFALLILGLLVAAALSFILCREKDKRGQYVFLGWFGNVNVAIPVAQTFYGAGSILHISLYGLLYDMMVYTVGILLLSGGKGKMDLREMLRPAPISSILCIVIILLKIQIPQVIVDTMGLFGNMMVPMTMMIVGMTLANLPVKDVFNEWRLYVLSAVKLLVMPILAWLIFRTFVTDTYVLFLMVLIASIPVGTLSVVLGDEFGTDVEFCSRAIFITTFLCVVTVPAVILLLF